MTTVDPRSPIGTLGVVPPARDTVTSHERSVVFELVFNVRDLGGLPTEDGRVVRPGALFRADGVHRLAGDDLERARALGLRTVVDLRTSGEIERSRRFPVEEHPLDWHHLPILDRMWSDDDLVATAGAAEFLCERYLDMLRTGADSIARIVGLASVGTPMLFHCAAGKDRTGVVAAILLSLVGVSADEIAADYHVTAGSMAAFVDWLTVAHPEALDSMTSQPPEYLEAPREAMEMFLERLADQHGSVERYVTGLGADPATIDRLRAAIVE